jgi:hypothetical protein
MFDPRNGTWSAMPSMLTPRRGLGLAALNGSLCVSGPCLSRLKASRRRVSAARVEHARGMYAWPGQCRA